MRIALLNLQYDNNYGGHLQRYALMKVLGDMGHDVTHLNLRANFNNTSCFSLTYNVLARLYHRFRYNSKNIIFLESYMQQVYEQNCRKTEPFYNRYIKHTDSIYSSKELKKYASHYDTFIVGSDQVWRKEYASHHGVSTFFFDFLSKQNEKTKKIAYGVSLGTDTNEFTTKEIKELGELYKKFQAVSVREDSALRLLEQYHWVNPQAIQVLDPTLLLYKDEYINLINQAEGKPSPGNMFCYILDMTDEKKQLIRKIAAQKKLTPFITTSESWDVTIEQWLQSFQDADYVVTDSYHGLIFSIIFEKPFYVFSKGSRGSSRFQSLTRTLMENINNESPDYDLVGKRIQEQRLLSIKFLSNSLKQ